jgi:uncharacterized protein YegL
MSSFARKLSYLVLFLVLGAVVTIVGCENMRTDGGAPQERLARDAMPQATLRGLVESKRAEGERNDESDAPEDMFFERGETNPFVATEDDALSTFAADVDSGSYTLARSYLARGQLPPRQAPRVEEFVNAIEYDYPLPQGETFAIHMALAPSRYGQDIKNSALLRIGIQAKEIQAKNRKPAVLTFVIDTSGSMRRENRLGLVQRSLGLLLDELHEDDLVGIAAYGSEAHEILAHTHDRKDAIRDALADLEANGSTNAEDGIRTGYKMAERVFRKGAINRVILCSDGVANVGATGPDAILATIVKQRRRGITLSALGVGMGNYNDHLLEQLGDKGDGHYAYIDSDRGGPPRPRREPHRHAAGRGAGRPRSRSQFDPKTVRSWRLIGYENRAIADADFRNDARSTAAKSAPGTASPPSTSSSSSPKPSPPKAFPPKQSRQVADVTVRHKHDEAGRVASKPAPASALDGDEGGRGTRLPRKPAPRRRRRRVRRGPARELLGQRRHASPGARRPPQDRGRRQRQGQPRTGVAGAEGRRAAGTCGSQQHEAGALRELGAGTERGHPTRFPQRAPFASEVQPGVRGLRPSLRPSPFGFGRPPAQVQGRPKPKGDGRSEGRRGEADVSALRRATGARRRHGTRQGLRGVDGSTSRPHATFLTRARPRRALLDAEASRAAFGNSRTESFPPAVFFHQPCCKAQVPARARG